jgi:hypothetical protein
MAFEVVVRQRPEGLPLHLVKSEMSGNTLQLKLIKDAPNVMTINGASLNLAQKRALRGMGTAWELTDLESKSNGHIVVTIRREGHLRKVGIATDGSGRFVDGQGDRVQVAMADPLTDQTWGVDRPVYTGE